MLKDLSKGYLDFKKRGELIASKDRYCRSNLIKYKLQP